MKKSNKVLSKKRRKTDIQRLRVEVENLAKEYAKKRDNYTCQKCGKHVEKSSAHGSHIIPVSHGNSLRFDPNNILCMCYHCHLNWWHKNPLEASAWFEERYPNLKKYIDLRKNLIVKYTLEDYKQMKENLRSLMSE